MNDPVATDSARSIYVRKSVALDGEKIAGAKPLRLISHAVTALSISARMPAPQMAKYQRSSIEAQIVGGIGVAAKGLGKAIASVPVIRDGPVDEALISAGESIGEFNRDTVQRKLQAFEVFEDNRMNHFVENLQSVNLLHNTENAMITDGTHLYLLQPA